MGGADTPIQFLILLYKHPYTFVFKFTKRKRRVFDLTGEAQWHVGTAVVSGFELLTNRTCRQLTAGLKNVQRTPEPHALRS